METGVQESSLFLKEAILRVQGQEVPVLKKGRKYRKRPAWLVSELFSKLTLKKESYKEWKCNYVTRDEYKNIT